MNQLYCGDNLHVLREYIQDESVDLIYLAPPFNFKHAYPGYFIVGLNKEAVSGSEGMKTLSPMKTPLTAAATTDCRELPDSCQTSVPEKSRLIFPGKPFPALADAGLGVTAALAQCFGDQRWPERNWRGRRRTVSGSSC